MKKVNEYLLVFFLFLAAALFSQCSLEGNCYQQLEVPVIRFEMPDSIPLDSTATIKVVYVTYSGCSKLNGLQAHLQGDTISLHVIADYDGCVCPDYLPDSIATYHFIPGAARNYIFRAWKYNNTILQDTLKVYSY